MRRGGAKSSRGVRQPYQRQRDKFDQSRPAGLQSDPVCPRSSAEGIAPATIATKPEEREPMKSQIYAVSPNPSADGITPATTVIKPERPPINLQSDVGSPWISGKGIALATTASKSALRKPEDLQCDQGSPKPSAVAEGIVPATAARRVMDDHAGEAAVVPERRRVERVQSATSSPLREGSGSTAKQMPRQPQQEERNKGSMLQEVLAPALQPDNQPTAVTGAMKIQVAAGQPMDKHLTMEKRQVKRKRLAKPQASPSKRGRGAPPRLCRSPSTSVPVGPDNAAARTAPDDHAVKLGPPSPLLSPVRSTAGESDAQPASGAASPICTSYDITSLTSADSPPVVPSPSKSTTNRGKRNDGSVDVRNKAPSPRRPHSTPLTAAELLVSYEKLYDMVQSRSQETVTRSALTRSWTTKSLAKSVVPGKIASVTIAVALCVLFLGALFLLVTRRSVIHLKLCRTEDCQRHATLLTEHLNTTLDPCDDFEAYVCSAWQISKQYREQARSVMDDLRFTWYQRFEQTLTAGSLKYSAGRKPLAMYHMCNLYFPSNTSQIQLIHEFFAYHGFRWPEPPKVLHPPLTLLVFLSYHWASPYWITVHLLSPSTSGRQRVLITPGLYVSILRNQHHSVASAYGRYWQTFLELFYPDPETRPPMNVEAVEEIRLMEKDVLDTLHAAAVSLRKRPAKFPFREIGNHLLNASATEWVDDFQVGMALRPNLTIDDEIVASDVAFLEVVSGLLDKYGPLKLNQHLVWLILQNYAPVTDYAFFVTYYGSIQKTAAYRPLYCAHQVEASYKVLVLALGVVARLTVFDRRVIDTGFKSLVSAASGRIRNTTWMDDEDKLQMIRKFASVSMGFLPPKAILDNGTLEGLYEEFPENEPSFADYWVGSLAAMGSMNKTREYRKALLLPGNNFPDYVNYGYISNTVRLAIGAAAAPAYYSDGTEAMLYGGLLFLLAMQMVKAIDEEGIKWYTNQTVLDDTILSNASLQAFRDRSECWYGASNERTFPEVPALEIAYAALKEFHLQHNTEPLALSEQLPEDKVFFMTLCYMTCSNALFRGGITADCNKVVRNSDAFARVYGCAKGSRMNPEKKCTFFA